jgi:hypothetical protein
MAKLGVVVHYQPHQLLDDRPRHTLQRSEARSRGSVASTVGRVQRFKGSIARREAPSGVDAKICPCALKLASNRANRHTLKAAPAAAILVSESGATVKRRKRRNGFRLSGTDWETSACVKMETESSVLIRPLIATPAQGVSRSRAETDVLQLSAAAGLKTSR